MVLAWLPYPYAGHFSLKTFKNREQAIRFIDITVPTICHDCVRMVNTAPFLVAVAAWVMIAIAVFVR